VRRRKCIALPYSGEPLAARKRAVASPTQRGQLVLHQSDIAEPAQGLGARLIARVGAAHQLRGPEVDMMRQLVADFLFEGDPPQRRLESLAETHGTILRK